MMRGGRWRIVGWGAAGVVLTAALISWAQYSPSGNGVMVQTPPDSHRGLEGNMEYDPVFVEKRLHAMNVERHKSLVSETEKLVKLARQLDAEVASNPSHALTTEELHKAAEIEKLARDVKTRMAQSFEGGPRFDSSPLPIGGRNQQ